MLQFVWRRLKPLIDALITERILIFHSAMVERGQIKPMQPLGVSLSKADK